MNDFESAWNSIAAAIPMPTGRGNFLFARQAMTLLEWSARLTTGGKRRTALRDLSITMKVLEPRYFTVLPGQCADNDDFILPYDHDRAGDRHAQLLWAMFDQIRNGGAHQYQQLIVELTNRRKFLVGLSGVQPRQPVGAVRRNKGHLGYFKAKDGSIGLQVNPVVLYLDVKEAIETAGLLTRRGLSFRYLTRRAVRRPSDRGDFATTKAPYYQFTSRELERALIRDGHEQFPSPT